ncbi:MAG: Folylpolyglutamate synthase [Actinobacteria bacterium ADurb.Bin346]|nr:MAG: Folylpolyglutamate synthase [Actinobacteria bacterium ADurb.Bin346]
MKKFSYKEASGYLDKCLIFGIKPGLERIRKLLKLLGEPQKKTEFIHIVGSNGKTSTAVMTAVMLYGQGLRSAYHISPHINEYTERFWFCGSNITEGRFAMLFSSIYPAIERVNSMDIGGEMTQFEIISAMGFALAAQENIDVMVLEAGLGGRWDATNAADAIVAGLTGVSLEHTAILGNTINEIATEKAQVIKTHSKVATASSDEKVLKVLKDRAAETHSELFIYGKDFFIQEKQKIYLEGWKVDIKGIKDSYKGLFIPLYGNYQPVNLSLSVALSELYMEHARKRIDKKKLSGSLSAIKVPGRFEVLQREPVVIADTSHNPEGIANFVRNILENFEGKKKIIIFSVLSDKDYRTMLAGILKISDTIILTSSNTARSLPVEILEKELYKLLRPGNETGQAGPQEIYKIDTISNSLNFALKISGSDDIICITGSITNLEDIVQED